MSRLAEMFDGGETASGRPYFVMELVRGVPITDFCDQSCLPVRVRLQLLQHAHQKGIIHRDLKPTNVLVTLHDSVPLVKVIDFGIAKATGQQLTEKTLFTNFAQMIGTPMYMSPEQAQMSAVDVDTRSDIYSLGVLLYELLTGTTPFDKERLRTAAYDEIRRIIREEEPAKPSTRVSTLGQAAATVSANRQSDPKRLSQLCRGELDWIVMKALDKDRNHRYETANGFAMDVQRYLSDEHVLACPPSAGYRLRKFVRRNKGPMLAAAAVTLALLLGIALTTWQAVRATRAAEAQKKEKEAAEASEAETRAVLDFVENRVFAAARPEGQEGGQGHQVTLRKAIEAALPFVEESFTDQPLIEARLRRTMGESFWYLGDAKIAAEQFQAARTLYARHRGPDHPDTLSSMNSLANSYGNLGRHADALELREQTLALVKARFGPDDPRTLSSMHNLANSYDALGRRADAFELRKETLALRRDKLGDDHPTTLLTMGTLANSYWALGRHADALKLSKRRCGGRKPSSGRRTP